MTIFVDDDWAEAHHDVHLMDEAGQRLAARRLPDGLEGIRRFHELVADHAVDPGQVVVGIEVDRGLWVTALAAAGYRVYAINPLSVSRYGIATTWPGPSPTPATPRCWPTWCAPTATTTAASPATAPTPRRSRSWPGDTIDRHEGLPCAPNRPPRATP